MDGLDWSLWPTLIGLRSLPPPDIDGDLTFCLADIESWMFKAESCVAIALRSVRRGGV